jgi:hypothetical protein
MRRSNKYQFYSWWFDPRSTVLEASTITITAPMRLNPFDQSLTHWLSLRWVPKQVITELMSKWCLTTKWEIFQLYHGGNKFYSSNLWSLLECNMSYNIIDKYTIIEWLLSNANAAIFQLYHGENKLIFNEMIMRSTLYQTNTLSWICIVLAHWISPYNIIDKYTIIKTYVLLPQP